jgi:hypothetical protein
MLNRKKPESQGGVEQAVASARQAATPKITAVEPLRGKLKYTGVSTRIEENRYQQLKQIFGARGITVSKAIQMCTDYIAKKIELGQLEITLGGIVDNRGRQ